MKIHIVKRDSLPLWKKAALYVGAVLLALLLGGILLLAIGVNPIDYYVKMLTMGMLTSKIPHTTFMNYLNNLVPLALTSVGLSLAFKMRFWNIGGEGQFIMGALATALVAITLGDVLPSWLVLVIMCLAAMLAAGLYGLIAAVLKVKFGTNETLLTLMLNYIALYALTFLMEVKASWNIFLNPEDLRPNPQSFGNTVRFPLIPLVGKFSLNICVPLALLVGLLVYIYLKRSKQGYEISVVGDSTGTAHYAGMKVNRIVLRTVFLSACLIGLAAAFRVGTAGTISTTITGDVGWTGIIVAWLAQLNTWIIFAVSALICLLHVGSANAQATFSVVDANFANMLQGAILFLVLAADFFIRFRVVIEKKGDGKNG